MRLKVEYLVLGEVIRESGRNRMPEPERLPSLVFGRIGTGTHA